MASFALFAARIGRYRRKGGWPYVPRCVKPNYVTNAYSNRPEYLSFAAGIVYELWNDTIGTFILCLAHVRLRSPDAWFSICCGSLG